MPKKILIIDDEEHLADALAHNLQFEGFSTTNAYDGEEVLLEGDGKAKAQHDLGSRIKKIRKKQGMSQKELSKLIGVTPSNISQVESNLIYPSLPALYKIAENLSVEVGSFFQDKTLPVKTVFPKGNGVKISMSDMPKESIYAQQLTPPDLDGKAELYLIQILPEKKLPAHFFVHKGEEAGYILSGSLKMVSQNETHNLEAGDTIYLKTVIPTQWVNPGPEMAKLLWLKIK